MFYCGLDVASPSSYLYLTDQHGHKLVAGPLATERKALTERLKPFLNDGLSIAVEAGNQTAWIHDLLCQLGAKVIVVNPRKVRAIAESRSKTDRIDAKTLGELLRLDGLPHPVHMPARPVRALRGLLVARRQLIMARTRLCNTVRGMLRQEGIYLPLGGLKSGLAWKKLLAAGYESDHLPVVITAFFESFKSLTASIRAIERELAEREQRDARNARLQSIPRVGRIASLTFLAAVDDVRRFPNSRKLVGYSGLAPIVRSSGERTQYGSISREGRAELRAVWVQIAHLVAIDKKKDTAPLRRWFQQVARRRGKRTAVVALARKLLTIAYQLLRHDAVYDPDRLRRKRAA
jgi:transposase